MKYRVVKTLTKGKPNIIKDQLIALTGEGYKGSSCAASKPGWKWAAIGA